MHPPTEAAIGAGDHGLPPDQTGMRDHGGGVAHHARDRYLAVGQLTVPPDAPFVLMADIACFERVGLRVDRQHDVDDIRHRDIGDTRYSSTVGAGLIISQFSAIEGSSSCSTRPASIIALYSSRIASAQA